MPTLAPELPLDAGLYVADASGERDHKCADSDCGNQAALLVMVAEHGVLSSRPDGCPIGGRWLPICLLCHADMLDGLRDCARCDHHGLHHQLHVINTRPLR